MSPTQWSNRPVLVTGGAGFIGSHLTEALVSRGARVRVADNLVRGRLESLESVQGQIEFLQTDLTHAESCQAACAGMHTVFHLASKVGGIGYYMQRPGEVYTHNLLMDNLMSVAARAAQVQRYLFSSSAHVYPRHLQATQDAAPLRESDASPADPVISYGWAKLASEKLLEYQNAEDSHMRTAVVRIVGAYGERQDIQLDTASAIPAFCRRAVEFPKLSPFTMKGEGRETRSYCFVTDVVDAMIRCVEKLETIPHIGPVNLGSEGRVSIGELARRVIQISGKPIAIQHIPTPESGIRGQAVACDLLHATLDGWKPKVDLEEGLQRVYNDVSQRLNGGGG